MRRKSKSNYTADWPEIANATKMAANWHCVRCGAENDAKAGYCLTVHHLDLDPANNAWWNLAALCQRCHLTIQAKVDMGRIYMLGHNDWFKPYVAGYYAHLRGLPEDRASVEANLDDLLDWAKLP